MGPFAIPSGSFGRWAAQFAPTLRTSPAFQPPAWYALKVRWVLQGPRLTCQPRLWYHKIIVDIYNSGHSSSAKSSIYILPGIQSRAPGRCREADPQSRLIVRCMRCSSSTALHGQILRAQGRAALAFFAHVFYHYLMRRWISCSRLAAFSREGSCTNPWLQNHFCVEKSCRQTLREGATASGSPVVRILPSLHSTKPPQKNRSRGRSAL